MTENAVTRLLLLAIQPNTLSDHDRMNAGLKHLMAEDPTLTVEAGPAGAVTLGAIGELQLEIVVERLKREFHVEASVGSPQIAYKIMRVPSADGTGTTRVKLEPLMRVTVAVPPEYVAAVVADLVARRGDVRAGALHSHTNLIHAVVRLADLFGYATDLRERTRGRGTYTLEFDSYQPVRDPGPTDRDPHAPVTAPLRPGSPSRSGIALPEPDADSHEL
jgi:translation elongation factor EF-G